MTRHIILALLCLSYYFGAGLAINVGYHRYLTHRALRLEKWLGRLIITLGLPAGTPVQWVGNHRFHHQHTDDANDPHSPWHGGFWYAHVGWYIGTTNSYLCLLYALAGPLRILWDSWQRPRTNQQYNHLAKDVSADPYYNFISCPTPFLIANLLHILLPFGLAYWLAGVSGLGLLWLTLVVIYNIGDAINSVGHLYGSQPFKDQSQARNNWLLGYLALGEGWHANHHAFPQSARHGLKMSQFDWAWQVIRLLGYLGLAHDIITPTPSRIEQKLVVTTELTELN